MITDTDLIAYELLSRDDIFDLHATRDAAELATFLIRDDFNSIIDLITLHAPLNTMNITAALADLHNAIVESIFDAHD